MTILPRNKLKRRTTWWFLLCNTCCVEFCIIAIIFIICVLSVNQPSSPPPPTHTPVKDVVIWRKSIHFSHTWKRRKDQVSSSSKWMSPEKREVPGKTVCASVPPGPSNAVKSPCSPKHYKMSPLKYFMRPRWLFNGCIMIFSVTFSYFLKLL